MLIIAFIVFTIVNPRFLQPWTISILLQQVAIIAALAIGQTLIILTAGIDLSVGALTVFSMLIMANLASDGRGARAAGHPDRHRRRTAGGLLNGFLVTRIKLPPFIVTLGTLSIFLAAGAALLRWLEHPVHRHAGLAELAGHRPPHRTV